MGRLHDFFIFCKHAKKSICIVMQSSVCVTNKLIICCFFTKILRNNSLLLINYATLPFEKATDITNYVSVKIMMTCVTAFSR